MRSTPWTASDGNPAASVAVRRVLASESGLFFAVAGLVLLTRVPFVDAGYGAIRDACAWRAQRASSLPLTNIGRRAFLLTRFKRSRVPRSGGVAPLVSISRPPF